MPVLIRVVQFTFLVFVGLIAEIAADVIRCLARGYRTGNIHVALSTGLIFVFSLSVFMCVLYFALVGKDTNFDFRRQKVGLITAFIVAALIDGYFVNFVCD